LRHLILAVFAVFAVPVFACNFTYDPVSTPQYYRAEGWKLPGTDDVNLSPKLDTYGATTPGGSIPGAVAEVLRHESPYVVEFPEQQFLLNGKKQKMGSAMVMVNIAR
jgi:hypothetical protein